VRTRHATSSGRDWGLAPKPSGAGARSLLHDRRGLSTVEYAVLFIVLLVAALALWSALGRSLRTQLDGADQTLVSVLQASNARGSAGPGSAPGVGAPGGSVGPSGALGHSPPSAATTAKPAARNTPTPTGQVASPQPSAATLLHVSAPSGAPAAPSGSQAAPTATQAGSPPQPSAARNAEPAAPQGWSERPIGTGGKVAVVAGGAVAGAAIAAGTSWGTAYAASTLCGPAAPACAGAVTVGLLGVGVYALATGGFSQLSGAFGRTFSSKPASVGDALTVGTTLGGLLYGAGEAAAATRSSAIAAGTSSEAQQVAATAGALERGSTTPTAAGEAEVFHATTSSNAAQGVLNGIDPKFLNPNTRFGRAFYTAEKPETALAELAHHGATPTHGIRYSIDVSKVRVLDLTDPHVAAKFGYGGGPITPQTQAIGARALEQGYSVIRFPSLRGEGNNLAILKDFNTILKPQMVSPATP
jgi:hypothetical protein